MCWNLALVYSNEAKLSRCAAKWSQTFLMWEKTRSVQVVIGTMEPTLASQAYIKETERDGGKERSLPSVFCSTDFCLESCWEVIFLSMMNICYTKTTSYSLYQGSQATVPDAYLKNTLPSFMEKQFFLFFFLNMCNQSYEKDELDTKTHIIVV